MRKILVRGTPQFVTVPLAQAHVVLAYRDELLSVARRLKGWWDESYDLQLFSTWGALYGAIAQHCSPPFEPGNLSSRDRHQFFIAKAPIQIGSEWCVGLSDLDEILGYSYPEPGTTGKKSNSPPPLTTGNPVLDLVTDICLVFKQSAPWLIQSYGVEEARLMLVQGNDRLRGEEAIKERNRKHDLERVGVIPTADDPLAKVLAQHGITIPGLEKPGSNLPPS